MTPLAWVGPSPTVAGTFDSAPDHDHAQSCDAAPCHHAPARPHHAETPLCSASAVLPGTLPFARPEVQSRVSVQAGEGRMVLTLLVGHDDGTEPGRLGRERAGRRFGEGGGRCRTRAVMSQAAAGKLVVRS